MEFIIEIYNFLIDIHQYILGVPEGITYALFGIKKKKKRAKRAIAKAQKDIDQALNQPNGLDSIPTDNLEGPDTSELIDGEPKVGEDIPNVPFIPQFPYLGKQIILNSGRLHLNANEDFILINSIGGIANIADLYLFFGGGAFILSQIIPPLYVIIRNKIIIIKSLLLEYFIMCFTPPPVSSILLPSLIISI